MQIGNNNTGKDQGGVFFLGVGCEDTTKRQKIFSGNFPQGQTGNITTYGAFFYFAEGDLSIESTKDRGIDYIVKGMGANVTNNGGYQTTTQLKTTGEQKTWKSSEWEVASTSNGGSVSGRSQATIDENVKKLTDKAKAYLNSSGLATAAKQQMPSPADYEAKYVNDPDWSVASGTTKITGNETEDLKAGKYEMYGTYNNGRVLNFDLTDGNATIYVSDDTEINNFRINVSNKTKNKLYIFVAPGKNLKMNSQNEEMTTGLTSCDQRRASVEGAHTGGGRNISLQNYELKGQSDGVDYRPKPGQAPAAVIIGLGRNTVEVYGTCAVCDAYVSLAGVGTNASTFKVDGNALFYGRFESDKFESGSNVIGLDYCPSIDEADDPNQPLTTHYRAKSYSYHY